MNIKWNITLVRHFTLFAVAFAGWMVVIAICATIYTLFTNLFTILETH